MGPICWRGRTAEGCENLTGISSDGTLGSIRGLYARPLEPDKAPDFTEEEQVRLALSYAGVAMGMWIKDGEVYVPFLDKTVMEVAQYLRPVHQVVGYDEKILLPTQMAKLWRG